MQMSDSLCWGNPREIAELTGDLRLPQLPVSAGKQSRLKERCIYGKERRGFVTVLQQHPSAPGRNPGDKGWAWESSILATWFSFCLKVSWKRLKKKTSVAGRESNVKECGITYYCLYPRLELVNLGEINYWGRPIDCSIILSYIDPPALKHINTGALKPRWRG